MKKQFLTLVTFFALTINGFAQNDLTQKKQKPSNNKRTEFMLKKMAADLELSEKQVNDLKPIIAEQQAKLETRKAEMKAKREEQLEKRKENMLAKKTQMLDEQIQLKSKMKTILNTEQMAKWEKIMEEKKAERNAKIKGKMHRE